MAVKLSKELFNLTDVKRIVGIVWNCSRGLTISRFSLQGIQALLPLVPLYLMKLLLDAFAGDTPPEFRYVMWILVGFALIRVLTIIISNVMTYVSLLQTDVVNDAMSNIVISKAINTDLEYFDSDTYHDIFQRALAQSSSRPLSVLGTITQFFQNSASLIAIAILLFTLHWGVTAILLVIAMPVALIRWYYSEQMVELRVEQTQKDRKSGYFKRVLTKAEYAKEVRIFSFGRKLLDRFLELRKLLRKEKRDLYLKQTRSVGVAQSIESIAIIAALGFIIVRAINGYLTVGDIALYYGAFQKGQSNIHGVLKSFVAMNEHKLYLGHLFTFLDLKKQIKSNVNTQPLPGKIQTIEIEDVRFTYPGTKNEILKGISFVANKGEVVAVVGENGSGKTTLVKLLTRLYDVSSGSISFNGIDIRTFDLSELRRKLTVIFQQFSKYNATVTENIQFADVFKPIDHDKITSSSEYAKADDFIKRLPEKFETALGRSFRSGEELSGGQWQKIAMARTFYKEADIIVMDEPTSFIDPLAEEEIFRNLKSLVKDKIMFLITHRIYNLKMADKILVMDDGKIVELGSHSELMEKQGLYYEMFQSQS